MEREDELLDWRSDRINGSYERVLVLLCFTPCLRASVVNLFRLRSLTPHL